MSSQQSTSGVVWVAGGAVLPPHPPRHPPRALPPATDRPRHRCPSIIGALYAGGGILLAWTAPIWLLCAALAWTPVGGRKLIEWVPVTFRWVARTQKHQTMFRRRVVKPRPAGTLALPGDAAALREWEDPETGAAMIHDPPPADHRIVGVSHPAFVLLDPGEQETPRRHLGKGACHDLPVRADRAPPSLRTHPPRRRLRPGRVVAAPRPRRRLLGLDRAPGTHRPCRACRGTPRHHHQPRPRPQSRRPTGPHQRRRRQGRSRRPPTRDDHLVTALRAAELTVTGWLTPAQVAVILRAAYDPATAAIPGTPQRHRPHARYRWPGGGDGVVGSAAVGFRVPCGVVGQ